MRTVLNILSLINYTYIKDELDFNISLSLLIVQIQISTDGI